MICQKAVPRPHFHANGSNAARPKCWRLVCRSSSSRTNILRYLRAPRAVSSVGSEHLVYTERAGGSSPHAHPEQSTKSPTMQGLFATQTRTKLACGRERAAKSRLARRAGFCACSENAPPLGPPTEACEGGSPPAVHARTKLACGRKRTVISFGATPQCFQEHHEARRPPQTNCRPPKPRLLSHHARGRHPVLPMESP